MDENTVRLLDLFRAYEPEADLKELLDDVKIFSAEVDMKTRSALVTICPDRYVALKQVRRIERGISRAYGIHKFTLRTCYGTDNLSLLKPEDVGDFLKELFAPCMSILAGCQYRLEGETVVLQLKGNGKEMLRPHVARAERWLKDMFDTTVKIDIQVGKELDAQELFEATEKIRQSAVAHMPEIKEPAPKAKVAAASNPNLLYGKPIKGDPIPMNTISMDSGRVVVEGEIFAMEHRELTKTKAWVINFDLTDYKGSVRVNRYMDIKRDKPQVLLDGLSKGMWVKIFGKVSFNRFENDITLEP